MGVLPDAEKIRQKAAEVVARPEFRLDSGVDRETITLWLRLLQWILTPFRWIGRILEGLPSPLWWLIVISLSLLVIALCGHILWSIFSAFKSPRRTAATLLASEQQVGAEELERAAAEAESSGDYIGTIRLLFKAGLRRIERAESKPIRRGITNHELLRRYRKSPLFEPLRWFVDTIDAKWYGHETCASDDCAASRAEYSRIRSLIERRTHAISP